MTEQVTRQLASFVVGASPADLPANVVHEASRSLINWLGCAIGASRHETVQNALAALTPFFGRSQASILGRSERVDVLHAALLNGMSSHTFDFDDTHLKTVIHPAGPVAAAVLALAEYQPMTGEQLMHALVLGIEVECRIGNAVYPSHYDIGWHITGTTGVFGAAAAAGKLLGLNELQMTWALGIAATQASGLREMFGSMCKPFHPGRAAQNGLTAALLAQAGFTSSEQAIEARRGFANVLATARNYGAITTGLGKSWEILDNTYKPFACGIVIHPTIDGCVQLRNEHGLASDDIESIELSVHPLVLELTGKKTPRTGLEGKFSVYHSAAVAIIDGDGAEAQYSDARVVDAEVVRLRDKVSASVGDGVHEDAALVRVRLKSGGLLEKNVAHAIGSLARPLTDRDIEDKFRKLCAGILPDAQVASLIDAGWKLATLPDASVLASMARSYA